MKKKHAQMATRLISVFVCDDTMYVSHDEMPMIREFLEFDSGKSERRTQRSKERDYKRNDAGRKMRGVFGRDWITSPQGGTPFSKSTSYLDEDADHRGLRMGKVYKRAVNGGHCPYYGNMKAAHELAVIKALWRFDF